jgi:hypothetical protein
MIRETKKKRKCILLLLLLELVSSGQRLSKQALNITNAQFSWFIMGEESMLKVNTRSICKYPIEIFRLLNN